MPTTLTQTSSVARTADGLTRFQILNVMTSVAAGALPSTKVFVFSVVDSANPKADAFERVADLVDLTTLPGSRDGAINQEQNNYLSDRLMLEYDDVVTASSAKQQLQARLDDLISQWQLYSTTFTGAPSVSFPLPESSVVTTAKAAYSQAKVAKVTADAAVQTASQTVSSAVSAAAGTDAALTSAQARASTATYLSSIADLATAGESAFRAAAATFLAAATVADAGLTDGGTFASAITAFTAARGSEAADGQANVASLQTQLAVQVVAAAAEVSSARAGKQAADAAVATARAALTRAQQAAAAATAAVDQALVAASELIPDFAP